MHRPPRNLTGRAPVVRDEAGRLRQSNPFSSWLLPLRTPARLSPRTPQTLPNASARPSERFPSASERFRTRAQVRIRKEEAHPVQGRTEGKAPQAGGNRRGRPAAVGLLRAWPCTPRPVCGSARTPKALPVASATTSSRKQLPHRSAPNRSPARTGLPLPLIQMHNRSRRLQPTEHPALRSTSAHQRPHRPPQRRR